MAELNDEQAAQWKKVKSALTKAIGGGLSRWIMGAGAPSVAFNPFKGITQPATSYGPSNYQGIDKMGRRLRLTEDETSPPMQAIKTAVTTNPILKDVQVKVGRFAESPNASGGIAWRDGRPPVIALSPDVSPTQDPGMVLVHEAVGHGSHGDVAGETPEVDRDYVRPRREGLATGVEKGVYGPLGLGLPSGYESQYGTRPEYKAAQEQGEGLAKLILQNQQVPAQDEVLGAMFQNKSPWPVKKAPVAMSGGS